MVPVVGFAAQKIAIPAHNDAAIAACAGKKVRDAVTLTIRGKKVDETSQEVSGVLQAVVHAK